MNFNIRQKLVAGFAVLLVALLGVGAFAYVQINQLDETLRLTQGKEALVGRAQSALWDLRWSLAQFLLVPEADYRKKIVDGEEKTYKVADDNLKAFGESLGLTPEELAAHKTATAAWNAYRSSRPKWFQLIAENKLEEAADYREKNTTAFGRLAVTAFDNLIDITAKSDAARREAQTKTTEQAKRLMLVLGSLAVALGLGVAYTVTRAMTNPIQKLQDALGKLGAGDYSARAQLAGKDELSQVGNALDKLLDERLEGLSKQAKEADQITNSVVEIMQAVGQVATNKDLSIRVPVTEDVTGAIGDAMNMLTSETAKVFGNVTVVSNNVANAVQQMKQSSDSVISAAGHSQVEVESTVRELSQVATTLNQLAQTAQRASESAELAVRNTRQALGTVDKTVSGINESRDLIRETEKRIKRLGERSQEISQVVGIINSIAERTGLLALNASMQATAAGEAGRGFALVAEEVKRLSENAREATREITTLVSSIQSETSETVLAMNNAITQVVDVSRLADQAGNEMKGVQQATEDLAGNVRNIAATSTEQARTGQTLQTSAHSIQNASRETSRQLISQNELANKLTTYSVDLVREVGVFKLPLARA